MAKEQRRIRAGNMHNGFAFHVDAIPCARSYKNVSSFAASRSSLPLLLIPSQKRGTRTQGCFPVLNNFKSHRPTDSYPLQLLFHHHFCRHLHSTNSRIQDEFSWDSFLPLEKYSLQFIEEKRSFNDPHYSPILRPNESFPFVSRNCRSPPVIGYTENFARYRVRGSFLEKCLHSWPGKNRAEPFNGLSLQLLLFDLGFVSVLRIFSAIGWIPRKFLSREKKERRHPRKILAQLIGKRTGTSTEIMFRFCSKSVYQHWPGYLAIPPCYNSYGALERTSLSPFYFGCRSDRFRRSGLVANSIDEQILVRCFPRLNVPDVIEHSNRQRVFNTYLIGFDRYNIIFFSMFKRFRRKNFYPRLIIFKRKASSRAIFICVKTMSLIDDDVQ